MEEKKIPMTQKEYQNLQTEIENLNHSQFSAHKEYEGEEIYNVRNSLIYKINELKKIMDNAIIIEPNDDVIDIGDKITILTGDIEAEEITLVLYDGRALEKRISIESEFGKILVGHKIGDKIPYRTETVQILGIQKAYKEKDNVLTKQL